jgi:RsiW-degrading membrane proteinase PrsW (M82 family)
VACGAGFAALETLGYAFTTLTTSHGDLSQVDGILMIRGVLSPAGHMAWTGLTAAALWRAAAVRFSARACWHLAGWFGAAVALHTAWDAIGSPTAYLVLAATGLGALTIVTHGLTKTLHRRNINPEST